MQRLAGLLVGEDVGAAVVQQHDVKLFRAVARVTPVQMELYGFMRSPVAERGRSCRKLPDLNAG